MTQRTYKPAQADLQTSQQSCRLIYGFLPEVGAESGLVRERIGGMNSGGAISENVAKWPLDLARCELFRDLPADRLADLQRQCRCARFAAGDMILAGEDNEAHNVFVILQGTGEVLRRSPFGALVTLAILHPGMYFGEFSAIDGRSGSATVRAGSDATLAEIPREVFRILLRDEPAVAWRMMERLVHLIRCLDTRVAGLHGCHEEVERIHRELFLVNL